MFPMQVANMIDNIGRYQIQIKQGFSYYFQKKNISLPFETEFVKVKSI